MSEIKTKDKKRISRTRKIRRALRNRIMGLLSACLSFLRYYIDLAIDKIFGLYYDSKVQRVCDSNNPLILESATSLARKIRKRQVTSEEVVSAFIDRINEVNGVVNAVVDNRFKAALDEARQIDKDISTGQIIDADFRDKPFLGVPFTTKESTAVKGMSFSFGLVKRKGKKASFDADCVELLKKAGGICLGVTNIPQLNLWIETSNPLYGITNNPYNTTRNVGGSSGGEASIIAAGGIPFGIGSDIGGSIRIPAFMCGVFGHKPTSHLVSTAGLTFRTGKEKNTMVVAGPMTKYAEDLAPMLKVLVAENANKLKLDQIVNVKDLNIFYINNPKDPRVSPFRQEMKTLFANVVNHFTEMSSKPQELRLEGMKYGGKLWTYWMNQEEGANFRNDINNREGEINAITAIIKHFLNMGDHSTATIFNLINTFLPKPKDAWAREQTEELKKQLLDKLGDNGILIYPSAPFPASYHHTALLRPFNFYLFAIWNVLKFPVTQVPLGLSEDGLPLGVQVVAAPYQDRLCLAVAQELERRFGGYVPPFKVT